MLTHSCPRRGVLCAVLLAAAAGTAGCGSSSASTSAPPSSAKTASTSASTGRTAPDPARNTVTIKNFAFHAPRTVKAGATVSVRNADDTTHTFAADDGSFDTGNIFAGTSKSFVAPMVAGIYKFHCNIHADMHGVFIVTG